MVQLCPTDKVCSLWLFNIAMETGPFIEDLSWCFPIYPWKMVIFHIAALNNQTVVIFLYAIDSPVISTLLCGRCITTLGRLPSKGGYLQNQSKSYKTFWHARMPAGGNDDFKYERVGKGIKGYEQVERRDGNSQIYESCRLALLGSMCLISFDFIWHSSSPNRMRIPTSTRKDPWIHIVTPLQSPSPSQHPQHFSGWMYRCLQICFF